MTHRLCRRCRRSNRPAARYCGTCGCPLMDPPPRPRSPEAAGGFLSWLLVAVILLAALPPTQPVPVLRSFTRPTGLLLDFPADFPPGHFSRLAWWG